MNIRHPTARVVAAIVAGATLCAAGAAAPPPRPPAAMAHVTPRYVPGEVLVTFKATVGARARKQAIAAHGHVALGDVANAGWVRVQVGGGQTTEAALALYASDPRVATVQPNYLYHALAVPNDPDYGQLWGLRNTGQPVPTDGYFPGTAGTPGADLNIEPAWDHATDCRGALVAVVDTGVNYRQEDLADNLWDGGTAFPHHGWDFVSGDDDPMDLVGHGTHVAGIIGAAGNNGRGVVGVCWQARIMALRALDNHELGTTDGISQSVDFAVSHGAKVINMSLGGSGADRIFAATIDNAEQHDVLVVVAAGNETVDNEEWPMYPCNYPNPNLICVAALNPDFELAEFSNWGATSVDVGAPGQNILSTINGATQRHTESFSTWDLSGGWGYFTRNGYEFLADPSTFGGTRYGPHQADTASRSFEIPAGERVVLDLYLALGLADATDQFVVSAAPEGTDPSAPEAILAEFHGRYAGSQNFQPMEWLVPACIQQRSCRVTFRLLTGATTPGDAGAAIALFSLNTLTIGPDQYDSMSGTSMASPEVAGVAALLRSFNPKYTTADTASAILHAGRPLPSLAGRTTSGRAVDVAASLAYLDAPMGLTATFGPTPACARVARGTTAVCAPR